MSGTTTIQGATERGKGREINCAEGATTTILTDLATTSMVTASPATTSNMTLPGIAAPAWEQCAVHVASWTAASEGNE